MRAFVVGALVALLALLAGCGQPSAPADPGPAASLDAALAHLEGQRGPDGRWSAGQVPYVLEAAVAAGLDVHAWPAPVPVAEQVAWPSANASFMVSLRPLHAVALSAAAAGDEARLAQVRERVLAGFDGAQFGEPALLNDDAFAFAVLGAAHADAATWAEVEPAVANLLEARSPAGGWSWSAGGEPESDMTGLVLQGLAQADAVPGADASSIAAFLEMTHDPSGGFALQAGGKPNCDSTVWAIRALAELDRTVSDADWRFLLDLQGADGGFAYTPGGPANALCTAEAATLLGLAAQGVVPFPPGPSGSDG